MNYLPLLVLIAAWLGPSCSASCPHEAGDLVKFSEKFTGNLEDKKLTIKDPILLDVEDVTVKTITIVGSGRLVFNRGIPITLRAKAILVQDQGQLLIGSKDCRHEDNVNIILLGLKGDATNEDISGPGGEEKYIIIKDDAVLNIHGVEKRAWTKIEGTVQRYGAFSGDPNLVKYAHDKSPYKNVKDSKKGLVVYVINPDHSIASYDVLDLNRPKEWKKEQEAIDDLVAKLDTIEDGQLVSVAIQKYLKPASKTDMSQLYAKLEEVAGIPTDELVLRYAGVYEACVVMFIKGGAYVQQLDKPISKKDTTAQVSLDMGDFKVTSVSFIESGSVHRSKIDLRIVHKSIGYPSVKLVHDVSSWNIGDEVVLTSTDYEADHAEVRTIKDIPSPNEVILSGELFYRHFGEIEHRVDMRGEMALLTRNIKIQGEVQPECPGVNGNCKKVGFDSFGGHIKMLFSFGEVYIQGAELTHMGQLGHKGVYPIHFHMCKNITGKTAIVEGNSIHHTFQRAITVHGTFGYSVENPGVVIKNNVAYHVFGHTFFLEDGAECATIFIGNLGALTMNVDTGFFDTDETEAATYWITNPEVYMVGNVAAGSSGGVGIWYAFPWEPVGPSKGLRYGKGEAFRTPIWTCDNNIVHSNKKGGFHMEKMVLNDGGKVGEHFDYRPRVDPKDENSAYTKVQIMRLTAYKNKDRNAWIRGGAQFMQYSSAESEMGLAMARATFDQQQFASKIIFIGISEGNGEDISYPDAYTPMKVEYHSGMVYIYGPAHISHAWFAGYKSFENKTYVAGGIGFKRKSEFPVSQLSTIRDFRFDFKDPSEGNRIFVGGVPNKNLGFENFDGNELAAFRDIDGSVYACDQLPFDGPKQFVKPEKFTLTDKCRCRSNWQMCICDDLYGSTRVNARKVWSGSTGKFNRSIVFKRLKYSDEDDTAYENHLASSHTPPRTLLVLGDDTYYYNIQFVHGFPREMDLSVDGVEVDRNVIAAMCMPKGAKSNDINLRANNGIDTIKNEDFIWGTSVDDVRNDLTMKTVFLDGRFLYLQFSSPVTRDHLYDTARCGDGECPRYIITMESELDYSVCMKPTDEELSTDYMPELVTELTCEYSTQTYEPDWGVGDTFASHDGAWSDWSGWATCESNTRSRTRQCDSPTPFGDGAQCGEAFVESEEEAC